MGYVVLWIENLVIALVLTALLLACVGRLDGVWRRRVWGVLTLAPIAVLYALAASLDGWFEFEKRLHLGLFWPLVLLFGAYLIGAILVWRYAMRSLAPNEPPAAAGWPRAKLSLVLAAAVVLHMMTFANLDSAARQNLASVRTDAAALSSSAAPERVPDHENAALLYLQVFDAMPAHDDWPIVWLKAEEAIHRELTRANEDGSEPEDSSVPFDFQSPELGRFLASQAGQLGLLRAAAAKPGCYFDKNYAQLSLDTLLPELQRMRDSARLLSTDARYRMAKGDLKGALADLKALFAMEPHIATEPFLVSVLVAAAIDDLACNSLQAVLNSKMTTEDLAAISIDGAVSYRRIFARAIRLEGAAITNFFADMDRVDNLREVSFLATGDNVYFPGFGPLYRVFLQADDMEHYREFLHGHELLANAKYSEAKTQWLALDDQVRGPRGLFTKLLTPALSSAGEVAFKTDARRRVAETALAMVRYRAARGKFPDRLDELAPEFLPVVPHDPFADHPLRLETNARGWIVYSVGPDQIDNRGARFLRNSRKGDLAFVYTEPGEKQPAE